MNFRIGCAVWAYKNWVGDLFPPKSRASNFLNLYSRRFTCVEGNTTFYSIPSVKTVKRWAAETPPGFHFCPKLPKSLTHNGLLMPSLDRSLQFLELMQELNGSCGVTQASRLGVLFAQLPPSYSPRKFDDLADFLQHWAETKAPLALEVRHPDWFKAPDRDRLNTLLESLNIGRVLLDTRPIYECDDDPQLTSERKKPNLPLQIDRTASFSLVRFISHPTLEKNESYLNQWASTIDQWLRAGTQVYFFVHCPIEARSPTNARYFQHLLQHQNAPVPPLPWDVISADQDAGADPPAQLNLF